jgi:aspartate/methionine/tyrosine aminotransferase
MFGPAMPHRKVEYLHWAKMHSQARWNLVTSGVAPIRWSELGVEPAQLEISGDSPYGYEPLIEHIAVRYGARPENVALARGGSEANFLVMAALLARGDRVLIERPCYEPLYRAAELLGAEIDWLERRFEDAYRVDPERVAAALTPRTRLIVLTSLHNPSGVFLDEETLVEVGEAAAVGAYVLVDEVYQEFLAGVRPAFQGCDRFISTNSLTKVYGLSGLRCGWVLAPRQVARQVRLVSDYVNPEGVLLGEMAAAAAFERIELLDERSRALMRANRRLLDQFLALAPDYVECVPPDAGSICFPRLRQGSGEQLAELLREKYDTSVVDGRFFAAPAGSAAGDCARHVRISISNETEVVREGLSRVRQALADLASASNPHALSHSAGRMP